MYEIQLFSSPLCTVLGVEIHKGDLCNERLLRLLFEKKKFDAVVHMAAQAGVTYSVENPLSYVTNNIECLVNLLDVLASYPVSQLFVLYFICQLQMSH